MFTPKGCSKRASIFSDGCVRHRDAGRGTEQGAKTQDHDATQPIKFNLRFIFGMLYELG